MVTVNRTYEKEKTKLPFLVQGKGNRWNGGEVHNASGRRGRAEWAQKKSLELTRVASPTRRGKTSVAAAQKDQGREDARQSRVGGARLYEGRLTKNSFYQ